MNRTRPPVDSAGQPLVLGDWVTASTPRGASFSGKIIRHRADPRNGRNGKGGGMGWLDVETVDGSVRSTRPSQCTKTEPKEPEC